MTKIFGVLLFGIQQNIFATNINNFSVFGL